MKRRTKRILAPFRAGRRSPSYADAGDFLRVISVLFVGWFHIWQQSWLNPDHHAPFHIYPLVACGYMFVDLMLLLSGFLLMLGWRAGRNRKPGEFYLARAARILPSYLLCILVMFFAFALPGRQYGTSKHMWTDLLSHLSFTHTLFPEGYHGTRLNDALWTLAVEVQFYLFFPLLARAFDRKPKLTYALMTAAGLGSRLYIALRVPDGNPYFNRLIPMLDVYANGMLAAHIYCKLSRKKQRTWQAWLSTALTVLSALLIYRIIDAQLTKRVSDVTYMGQMFWRLPLSVLGCVFIVCGSRSIKGLRMLFSNPVVRFLSGISFNFYIWHMVITLKLKEWRIPFYEGVNPNQRSLQPWQDQYTLLCFGVSLLLAVLLTYLVEKPCAKWIKRAFSRKST